MQSRFDIRLFGTFDVLDADGLSRVPPGKRARALLALLATAPNFKRSRQWLKMMLWEDFEEKQASANLRSCLYALKKFYPDADNFIHSDRNAVWLDAGTRAGDQNDGENLEFLEGFDIGGEAFEDWLREQRSIQTVRGMEKAASQSSIAGLETGPDPAPVMATLPRILICPVIALSQTDQLYGDMITDVIIDVILQYQVVDVFDLRHSMSTSLDADATISPVGLVVRMFRAGGTYQLNILLKNNVTGTVIWSRIYPGLSISAWQDIPEQFSGFAAEVANAVFDQAFLHYRADPGCQLIGAIHNVLSHTREGQANARAYLQQLAPESAIARAWLMYTFAVSHAERMGGLDPAAMEELEEHCVQAHQEAPSNPIVQAIIGHINAFVFRRFEIADHHHETARAMGQNLPIVWTLSAMHANYANQSEKAYQYSGQALSQSRFCPYRYFFEGPYSISCSLTNRHEEAVKTGQGILARKPGFLAVMRHVAASQALSGNLENARGMVEEIRAKDNQFVASEIADDNYPLPSANSVHLIRHAFELTGTQKAT